MQIITATTLGQPREIATKYGPRIVAELRMQQGDSAKMWAPPHDRFRYLLGLQPGQAVKVGLHNTGKLAPLDCDDAAIQPAKTIGFDTALPAAPALDRADRVAEAAELYAQAFLALQSRLGNQLEPSQLVSAASTVFIQISRQG